MPRKITPNSISIKANMEITAADALTALKAGIKSLTGKEVGEIYLANDTFSATGPLVLTNLLAKVTETKAASKTPAKKAPSTRKPAAPAAPAAPVMAPTPPTVSGPPASFRAPTPE